MTLPCAERSLSSKKLCPPHRTLAVADVAGVDLLHQGAHLFQRIPLLLDEGTHPGAASPGAQRSTRA